MNHFFHKYGATFIIGVILLASLGYGIYIYAKERHATNARLNTLETQLSQLSAALQQSGAVSDATAQQIQELENRGTVSAKSQNDLLTATVAKSAPAVVSIVISEDVPLLQVQYVNPFGNDPTYDKVGIKVPVYRQVGTQKKEIGAGTGFFIRSDGYIITNKHVADNTAASYTALLSSGEKKVARVVYRDPTTDIAILKVDGSGYATIPLGSSSDIKLGQTVAAIGNALGEYNNSVSVGIISGLDRTIKASDDAGNIETLTGVIQTDAAINKGNSGGPLLDLDGKAIGINTAVSQGANSIGFAIPITAVKVIVDRILP